jgi:hypothetical protein
MRMLDHAYLIHSVYAPQVQPFRLALAQNQVWRFLDRPDPLVLELFLDSVLRAGRRNDPTSAELD